MSEVRREVLRLLAEGRITVDEAERLLAAVEESRGPRVFGRQRAGRVVADLADALSDLGAMVRDTVEAALTGMDLGSEGDREGKAEEVALGGPIALEKGTKLEIVQRRTGVRGAGQLLLEGGSGDSCVVYASEATGTRVWRRPERLSVDWSHGTLKVQVPPTASEVVARVSGGSIKARAVPCPLHLGSLVGGVTLEDVAHPFEVRTLGGGTQVSLAQEFSGEGKVQVVGGSVEVRVPSELCLWVRAVTTGGSVEVEGATAEVERSRAAGRQAVSMTVGQGAPAGRLVIRAVGGGVAVRRVGVHA